MKIKKYLKKLVLLCGIQEDEINIEFEESEESIKLSLYLPEEKVKYFIGSRGRTLGAIEYMIKVVFSQEYDNKKIVLDINDYKKEKEQELYQKVDDLAQQALQSGKRKYVRGLNSYERYLVHSYIAKDERYQDLETFSQDEGDIRTLVINKKNEFTSNI